MVRKILRWIDQQTQLITLIREFMEEPLAEGVGWPHVFGSAVLFLFVFQLCTGVLLMVYYSPSPDAAYESTIYITQQAPMGGLVRSLHHWGASFMLVLLAIHMLQAFFWGAYKPPRQIVWVIGVGLMLVTFGLSFTGYLLPWDQKAYWATVVGTRIAGSVPEVGKYIVEVIRGGSSVGALTLTRFFALHTLIFPALLAGLIVFHVAQVRAHGITAPWRRVGEEADVPKPQLFYPDQVLKDLVISLALLAVLFGVASNYPAPLEAKADPTATGYVPRPEWYFLPNFELLKHIPTAWGEWGEFLGAAVIPGLVVLGLVALPYFDRNPERVARRRPLSVFAAVAVLGTMTYLGVAALASAPRETRLTPLQAKGEKVFLDLRCQSCHGINGGGGLEGQDLAAGGPRDPRAVAQILRSPTSRNPRSIMPPVSKELEQADFEALVAFVSAIDPTFRMPTEAVAAGARRPPSHQTENWFANHRYEVYKDPSVCSECHKPTFCQSCHLKRRPDSHLHGWMKSHFGTAQERPEYCQVCHDRAFCNSCHDRVMHTEDWMHSHQGAARTDSELCKECHRADFCVTCHRGATPASHDRDWLQAHRAAPTADCATCHTTSFCSSCHTGARPASHDAAWVGKHGSVAKGEVERCATCHRGQFCQDCHGGIGMPHGKDWAIEHKAQASFSPGSACYRCHQYERTCADCHGPEPPK